MDTEIIAAYSEYLEKWQRMVTARHNKTFFEQLKPVALGWKVADKESYIALYTEHHDSCERIVETWMNGRWIAKLYLKQDSAVNGVRIVKLMERRPGSDDALGLDHVDFYSRSQDIRQVLEQEPDLEWTLESNDVIDKYEWLSVWFENTEAKIKSDTVLDIIIKELEEVNNTVKS